MKIVNIDVENILIFQMTWKISMKFSGKMWVMIIVKIPKSQGFTLLLEDTFFEKPHVAEFKLTSHSFLKVEKIFENLTYIIVNYDFSFITLRMYYTFSINVFKRNQFDWYCSLNFQHIRFFKIIYIFSSIV